MARRKGHDPVHAFRAPGSLVSEAKERAAVNGETLSDVIRRALEEYVSRSKG